ncbi:ABC transporter ATP-binding protein [Actinospica acidiphila]|uniref:ABC transporter ATP-binding protein n=1 Tax=Actinospica acidiphila TaxID=304899 RepID=UPI00193EE3E3|nr:ATP-binding cassette domain-containing protein [Actinospica acidiphila]MBM4826928.1 ATP-binding cassette domain-containing protein [Actinospica acidiphila]
MASPQTRPLDHRYRGEHPVRTLGYLFRADRGRLAAAVVVFTVKHSPVWLLPLITASIIDTVVQHQPVSRLWTSTGVIMFILLVNYPLHVLYVRLLYGSVRRMGTTLRSALCTRMQQLSIGYHSRVSAGVLQAPELEDNEGKAELTALRGAVTFEGVGHAYDGDDRPAVRDFTLDVASGETIALVGASGAGKSTVLNLVIGFIRPTSGRLLVDGTDMNTLDLRTYRRFLSVVPQESILFDGTVRENVAYGMDDADEETVRAALRDANALEFVDRLPQGLDTLVGERGARLSGGQRQRLAIARALIRDPKVLVLDEATSALDTRSEALVQEALARLLRGRTTFVVAHRLSTVRGADRIVVMSDGAIQEIGTHEELLRRGGAYTALHSGQVA